MNIDSPIFENLPEDPELSFSILEEEYRTKMENGIERAESGSAVTFYKRQYINAIIAVSETLGID